MHSSESVVTGTSSGRIQHAVANSCFVGWARISNEELFGAASACTKEVTPASSLRFQRDGSRPLLPAGRSTIAS